MSFGSYAKQMEELDSKFNDVRANTRTTFLTEVEIADRKTAELTAEVAGMVSAPTSAKGSAQGVRRTVQRCADQELPLYDPLEPGEPPPLPAQAAPVREIVSTVVDTIPFSTEKGKALWGKRVHSQESTDVVQDVFWWWFSKKYKPNAELQYQLYDRAADNFSMLFINTPEAHKDAFFTKYHGFLAQSVFAVCWTAFPESREDFENDDFKSELCCLAAEWTTGRRLNGPAQDRSLWDKNRMLRPQTLGRESEADRHKREVRLRYLKQICQHNGVSVQKPDSGDVPPSVEGQRGSSVHSKECTHLVCAPNCPGLKSSAKPGGKKKRGSHLLADSAKSPTQSSPKAQSASKQLSALKHFESMDSANGLAFGSAEVGAEEDASVRAGEEQRVKVSELEREKKIDVYGNSPLIQHFLMTHGCNPRSKWKAGKVDFAAYYAAAPSSLMSDEAVTVSAQLVAKYMELDQCTTKLWGEVRSARKELDAVKRKLEHHRDAVLRDEALSHELSSRIVSKVAQRDQQHRKQSESSQPFSSPTPAPSSKLAADKTTATGTTGESVGVSASAHGHPHASGGAHRAERSRRSADEVIGMKSPETIEVPS